LSRITGPGSLQTTGKVESLSDSESGDVMVLLLDVGYLSVVLFTARRPSIQSDAALSDLAISQLICQQFTQCSLKSERKKNW
jgi:hypothetical protein